MSRRVRVLFAIGSLAGGGAERQVLDYLRLVDRTRFEPLLYLLAREGELLGEVPSDVRVFAFGDRHPAPRMNYPGRIHRQQVRDLARVMAEAEIDVLCAMTLLLMLVAPGSVRRRPTPWLGLETSDPRLGFNTQVNRFRWFKYRLLRRAFHSANAVVAVSDGARDGISEFYGLPAARVTTIHNFVDPQPIDRMAGERGPDLDADRFHIVTVGRLAAEKGHIYLLRAVRELIQERGLHKLQLHLLGKGPLDHELRTFVAANELEPFVRFAGFTSNPFAYVRHCQLFCLPSLFEGLPLALLEAMLCRVPVLASDCRSGPREVLAGGRYGRLVPPADERALARAIEEMMTRYDDCRARVAEAREHVIRTYSPQRGMAQLEALLSSIAGQS